MLSLFYQLFMVDTSAHISQMQMIDVRKVSLKSLKLCLICIFSLCSTFNALSSVAIVWQKNAIRFGRVCKNAFCCFIVSKLLSSAFRGPLRVKNIKHICLLSMEWEHLNQKHTETANVTQTMKKGQKCVIEFFCWGCFYFSVGPQTTPAVGLQNTARAQVGDGR